MIRNLISACLLAGLAGYGTPALASSPSVSAVAQQQAVKGTVVDENGEPLIGVTVQVIGQSGGTVTDIDGNFNLNVKKGAKLKFSYVGYVDQTVEAGTSPLNIKLQPNNKELQEVVVVGYGTQKKESLTGAVTVVDAKAFQDKGSVTSPLQALQGSVPGVIITRGSGAPGDESWGMTLRGAVSTNTASPLVIVDGVEYSDGINGLRNLNSNDIESINFLKDASAAIYGSKAAGGVCTYHHQESQSRKDHHRL